MEYGIYTLSGPDLVAKPDPYYGNFLIPWSEMDKIIQPKP